MIINLSCNCIGDTGIVALAEALSSLQALETQTALRSDPTGSSRARTPMPLREEAKTPQPSRQEEREKQEKRRLELQRKVAAMAVLHLATTIPMALAHVWILFTAMTQRIPQCRMTARTSTWINGGPHFRMAATLFETSMKVTAMQLSRAPRAWRTPMAWRVPRPAARCQR